MPTRAWSLEHAHAAASLSNSGPRRGEHTRASWARAWRQARGRYVPTGEPGFSTLAWAAWLARKGGDPLELPA